MRARLQPGNNPSRGLQELSRSSGIRRLRRSHSLFRPRATDLIINWGNPSTILPFAQYLNHPEAVSNAGNKIITFEILERNGVVIPKWSTHKGDAREWLNSGHRVISRSLVRGSQGRGCDVYSHDGTTWTKDIEDFLAEEERPLYVQVFGHLPRDVVEYRVHVFQGSVIDVQQKRKRRTNDEDERANPYIRSAANGWVFCREAVHCPEDVKNESRLAVTELGLDFGAVDIGYDMDSGEWCVYEVNTAPGLEGTTLERYTNAVQQAAGDYTL